jgi:hypothetical protein
MSDKPADKPEQPAEPKHQVWHPRMPTQRVLHAYANVDQEEPDPLTESPKITDPNEDTAPLHGSLDRSDTDSVVPNYSSEPGGDSEPAGRQDASRADKSAPAAPAAPAAAPARSPRRSRKRDT